jgi:hypothetical protein
LNCFRKRSSSDQNSLQEKLQPATFVEYQLARCWIHGATVQVACLELLEKALVIRPEQPAGKVA